MVTQEDLAFFSHADIRQNRRTTTDHTDWITAGMGIDTDKGMRIHIVLQIRKTG
jgi:hypothetical protein